MGTRFEVTEGATVIYRTNGWPPVGTAPFRQSTMADATHRIAVARDEGPVARRCGPSQSSWLPRFPVPSG
jgi:hypothetical protein